MPAEPELDERSGVESANRNPPAPRLLDDRAGRWPESERVVQVAQSRNDCCRIKPVAGKAGPDDVHRLAHRFEADFLFLVCDGDGRDERVAGLYHSAETHVDP